MGEHALAGAFLKAEDIARERKYPLVLHFCEECGLVQVEQVEEQQDVFKNTFYHSSDNATLRTHFMQYAEAVTQRFRPQSVLEIGCNDGVMLRPLASRVTKVIGIDPAECSKWINDPRMAIGNDYWNSFLAKKIGMVDMVIANNVLAHIPDINDAIHGIEQVMAQNGVLVLEVNYLGDLIAGLQYDWINHEHLYYWSLNSLNYLFGKHGLTIFDVHRVVNHAGSIRVFVCKDNRPIEPSVFRLLNAERVQRFQMREEMLAFSDRVFAHRTMLISVLNNISRDGKLVAGYGACGRSNTMIQFCDIKTLCYMVDDSTAKQGYLTPGSHLEVRDRSALDKDPVDYVLVFAWSFLPEIRNKIRGQQIIVPLPTIRFEQEMEAA